ncbi:DUF3987 domain-containing protein [Pseudomonas aeruginosa]
MPTGFVGVALVVAVSAVVGRKFTIHPKQHDDWTVVPNQWGVIIGRPSAMKTPALKQALRPLDALRTRERNQHSLRPWRSIGPTVSCSTSSARLLRARPRNLWRLVDRWPNQAAAEQVKQVIDYLDQLPSEPRTTLRFSPEAQEIFNAWYTRHMQQSRTKNFTQHCNPII